MGSVYNTIQSPKGSDPWGRFEWVGRGWGLVADINNNQSTGVIIESTT